MHAGVVVAPVGMTVAPAGAMAAFVGAVCAPARAMGAPLGAVVTPSRASRSIVMWFADVLGFAGLRCLVSIV